MRTDPLISVSGQFREKKSFGTLQYCHPAMIVIAGPGMLSTLNPGLNESGIV